MKTTLNFLPPPLPPKDKRGLNQRLMELSDEVRTRGGRKSRRRTARVWKPAT